MSRTNKSKSEFSEDMLAGESKYFMIKEIKEQPLAARRLLNSLETAQFNNAKKIISLIKESSRVLLLGCGTSYHAALVGEFLFNKAGIEAFASDASDFSEYLIKGKTLIIAISQSGETIDIIDAIKKVRQKKDVKVVALVNVPHSTIQKVSMASIEISAGKEVCVAATKSFTNQVLTLMYLAKFFRYKINLKHIPEKIQDTLKSNEEKIKKIAQALCKKEHVYVLGKGVLFPVAKEIALKIKEISYIHAEGMQAGELKHGTIALIEKGTPVLSLVPNNDHGTVSSTKEVESRGAFTIAITNTKTDLKADAEFTVPKGDEVEFALYSNIIGQLLTYYLALELKRPIDKPRNLAKSVTVL